MMMFLSQVSPDARARQERRERMRLKEETADVGDEACVTARHGPPNLGIRLSYLNAGSGLQPVDANELSGRCDAECHEMRASRLGCDAELAFQAGCAKTFATT
ncbi:MAG TPA: hypothetical protein VHB46_11080 [Burkholderiales bacterium]|nr:hypothetical protein [Burkholderiales bacterium]